MHKNHNRCCTEIPLAIPDTTIDDMIVIDPTRILARALIREANPNRLKLAVR